MLCHYIGKYYYDNTDIEKAYSIVEVYINHAIKVKLANLKNNNAVLDINYVGDSDYEDKDKLRMALYRKKITKKKV